jgi:hypothetical protein
VQQRGSLEEVGCSDAEEHASGLVRGATEMGQPLLQAGTRVGIFRLVVAQPVVPQLVTLRGVHRRQELEGVERLATGVDLLEDEADGFMRCVGAQPDDRNLVFGEILQHLILELLEDLAHLVELALARPMIIEAVRPGVPVEGLVERIHQLLVLESQRREIQLDVLVEVLLDATVLRNGEDRGVAIGISGQCLADVDVEPTSDQALLRGDRREVPRQLTPGTQ